ncbi:MAG: hypothetical protein IJL21_00885 [Alphaproteobacteria bacterium]|nr:hypothetical protein [Alphaproteobacteria bacterium]
MKRILIALFTVFACCKTFAEPSGGFIPQLPPTYSPPEVVEYAIEKYVVAPYDPNAVKAAYEKYMNQDDGTIIMENLQQKVCPAGGMDFARCKEFTNALMIPYYDVCDSGKGKSGGNEHCEKNFFYYAAPKNLSFGNGTYVRTKEAIGLAQEYALVKDKQKVVCVSTKGNSKKNDTIWCTSIDKKHFYEFKFNNIKETKDDYIKQSLLSAICKLHNTKYTASATGAATSIGGTAPGYSWPDSCETADKLICANINQSLGRFSYKATIGTSDVPPIGKHSTCVIEKVVNDISNLRTTYGIDPTVFKTVQALVGEDIDKKIKQYVKQELQKQKITFDEKSFHCADSTNVLNGGDVLTCYVNNKPIDFLFKDLSEWNGVNKRGGAQAMDCIVSGGTYTGKRCTNLNQKQCEMLRSANLKSCPSCNMVRWDAKNKVCTLPSSAAATNLQKDMKVVAIVGGAVVGAAITIATAGTAGLTAGGYVILGVETTGAGIEWWAQSKIDKLSDEFFLKANNCNNENCAAQLIEQYLTDLAAIDRDLTDTEADAVDKEMARLVELIPTNSNLWIDKLRNEDGTSFLEKADNGHWTAAQVWRAVGIGMQFAGVASSITGWIIKKTKYLEKTLDRTSRILLNNARIAEKNIVKVDKLDDIEKEWFKLWQEYAPKNQTLEQFKAMTNGNLDEMKEMATGWRGARSSRQVVRPEVTQQIQDLKYKELDQILEVNTLQSKYGVLDLPSDPDELTKLYKQHPDLKNAKDALAHTRSQINDLEIDLLDTPYSTYDPEFTRISKQYQQKIADVDIEKKKAWQEYQKLHPSATMDDFNKTDAYKQFAEQEQAIRRDYQFEVAEKFPLENLGNVVNERADDFAEIIANNPEIKAKLDPDNWQKLVEAENGQADALIEKLAEDPTIKSKLSPDWQKLDPDQRRREMAELIKTDSDVQWIVDSIYPELRSTKTERTAIVQQIVDKYSQKTSTQAPDISSDYLTTAGGYYTPGTNNIALNPYAQFKTSDGMVETMAHEHGHFIDYTQPNEGAMGEQFSHYAKSLYSSRPEDGYRISLTEQSSFKIGPNVSHEATGTTHYSHGKEYDLERAKESERILQENNKYDKEVFDEIVEAHSSEAALGATGIGVTVGTTKSIIQKKEKK